MDDEKNIDNNGVEGEENENGEEEQKEQKTNWVNLTTEDEERIKDMFDFFDKEKNNYIEPQALGPLLRGLKFNPTDDELTNYVKTYDSNQSEQIHLSDIKKIVDQKMSEPDTFEEFIEAAKVFDLDNDGKIEV